MGTVPPTHYRRVGSPAFHCLRESNKCGHSWVWGSGGEESQKSEIHNNWTKSGHITIWLAVYLTKFYDDYVCITCTLLGKATTQLWKTASKTTCNIQISISYVVNWSQSSTSILFSHVGWVLRVYTMWVSVRVRVGLYWWTSCTFFLDTAWYTTTTESTLSLVTVIPSFLYAASENNTDTILSS